jgi:hypothetical protein
MKAGDRVKTDRRDARMLAKLHRAGELTEIWIPDAAHEADYFRSATLRMRLCAGHPAQPSTVCMPRTGRRSLSGHRV